MPPPNTPHAGVLPFPPLGPKASAKTAVGGSRPAPPNGITVVRQRREPVPTAVFDTYWQFAARRQAMYFARLSGARTPWTDDPILRSHRFTNAYRVLDRVSQYLVAHVIPAGADTPDEIFFRVLLFKLFNKVETWETLTDLMDGTPSWEEFDLDRMDAALSTERAAGRRIYSAAYIMPAASRFEGKSKHSTHLRLLEWMIASGLPQRIASAPTMGAAYSLLRDVPSFGDFLAYQLVTDLNYSTLCWFDEMEFVQPGPGARDGIAKCFSTLGDYTESEAIRWVADSQSEQFSSRGLQFQSLWGRPLQLIDCQNLFCEVSKYSRVAHPEVAGNSGRTKIKQKFEPAGPLPTPTLPPKWGIHTGASTSSLTLQASVAR